MTARTKTIQTGAVVVRDTGTLISSHLWSASGNVKVQRRLNAGAHLIRVRYAGEPLYRRHARRREEVLTDAMSWAVQAGPPTRGPGPSCSADESEI